MRGRGARFDTPHRMKGYIPAANLLRSIKAPANLPALASLARFEGRIFDQGPTGSCEGHRASMGLQVAFNYQQKPLGFVPSPAGIYRDARAHGRITEASGRLLPLQDEGAMTSDVVAVMYSCGVAPMTPLADRYSDCDPTTINLEPTLTELSTENQSVIAGAFAVSIYDVDAAIAQMKTFLSAGFPIALDIYADSIFDAWGDSWDETRLPLSDCDVNDLKVGGHAILVTEIEHDSEGNALLSGPNSWSEGWGAPPLDTSIAIGGHWRATSDWFRKAVFAAYVWKADLVAR